MKVARDFIIGPLSSCDRQKDREASNGLYRREDNAKLGDFAEALCDLLDHLLDRHMDCCETEKLVTVVLDRLTLFTQYDYVYGCPTYGDYRRDLIPGPRFRQLIEELEKPGLAAPNPRKENADAVYPPT